MADQQELLRLAERVGQMTKPDRELHGLIHKALFNVVRVPPLLPPDYYASLDAIMVFVGDGFGSLITGKFEDGATGFVAVVLKPTRAEGEARTPAAALCVAALKACAAIERTPA